MFSLKNYVILRSDLQFSYKYLVSLLSYERKQQFAVRKQLPHFSAFTEYSVYYSYLPEILFILHSAIAEFLYPRYNTNDDDDY